MWTETLNRTESVYANALNIKKMQTRIILLYRTTVEHHLFSFNIYAIGSVNCDRQHMYCDRHNENFAFIFLDLNVRNCLPISQIQCIAPTPLLAEKFILFICFSFIL